MTGLQFSAIFALFLVGFALIYAGQRYRPGMFAAPDPDDPHTPQLAIPATPIRVVDIEVAAASDADRDALYWAIYNYLSRTVVMPPQSASLLAVEIVEIVERSGWRALSSGKK